jgi:hypothetical protein
MSPWRAFCQTLHVVALGLWLGTLVMVAAAAAILFPTMRSLAPRLPAFAAYDGDHWRLAAGRVGQQLFLVADVIQFACALAAAATFLAMAVLLGMARGRASTILRALALSVAVASAAGQIIVLAPSMNAALRAYWAAALAGDTAAAGIHQAAFNDLHPYATALLAVGAVAVLIALVGAAAAAPPGASDEPAPSARLPEPALLRMRP